MKIIEEKFDFWIKNSMNVLLIGKKGCGKTTMAIESLDRNNVKFKYFSAPTLDPWIDFIGIPKENDKTNERTLEYIKPAWHKENIECIIIDEYNRGKEKLRAACLELIQFKSINGTSFPNLKMVWAMINEDTEDEEYNVDYLDPAEKDRFQVQYKMKYAPEKTYFYEKFGENGNKACLWWDELPTGIKNQVSPRRLEYAIDYYNKGGDVNDILVTESNPNKLTTMLKKENITKTLDGLRFESKDKIKEWFLVPENYDMAIKTVTTNSVYLGDFLYSLPQEKIVSLVNTDSKIQAMVIQDYCEKKADSIKVLETIIKINPNSDISKKILQTVANNKIKNGVKFGGQNVEIAEINELSDDTDKNKAMNELLSIKGIKDIRAITYEINSVNLDATLNKVNELSGKISDKSFDYAKWIPYFNRKIKDSGEKNTLKYMKQYYIFVLYKILRMGLESKIYSEDESVNENGTDLCLYMAKNMELLKKASVEFDVNFNDLYDKTVIYNETTIGNQ